MTDREPLVPEAGIAERTFRRRSIDSREVRDQRRVGRLVELRGRLDKEAASERMYIAAEAYAEWRSALELFVRAQGCPEVAEDIVQEAGKKFIRDICRDDWIKRMEELQGRDDDVSKRVFVTIVDELSSRRNTPVVRRLKALDDDRDEQALDEFVRQLRAGDDETLTAKLADGRVPRTKTALFRNAWSRCHSHRRKAELEALEEPETASDWRDFRRMLEHKQAFEGFEATLSHSDGLLWRLTMPRLSYQDLRRGSDVGYHHLETSEAWWLINGWIQGGARGIGELRLMAHDEAIADVRTTIEEYPDEFVARQRWARLNNVQVQLSRIRARFREYLRSEGYLDA